MHEHAIAEDIQPRKSVTNIVKKLQAKEVFMNQMGNIGG
jgi:hypothetical protein